MSESQQTNLAADAKRQVLRHLVATVAYRGGLAVSDAPENFAAFRAGDTARSAGEILAHIGDLLEGSLYLVKGELVYLTSAPLQWEDQIKRFFAAVKAFDSYLASEALLACQVEKLVQGPIGDALTHVGQLVMMRRLAGKPMRVDGYFTAEIVAGEVNEETFKKS